MKFNSVKEYQDWVKKQATTKPKPTTTKRKTTKKES